jgi:hypothetical protein
MVAGFPTDCTLSHPFNIYYDNAYKITSRCSKLCMQETIHARYTSQLQECHCTLDIVRDESRFTTTNALLRPHIHPSFQNWDIVFMAHVIFRIQWGMSLDRSVSLAARLLVGQPRYRSWIPLAEAILASFKAFRPDLGPTQTIHWAATGSFAENKATVAWS